MNAQGETVRYFCDFDKIDNYKLNEKVDDDCILVKELDDFGHRQIIRGVRKMNILV